ncbi:substrate-binding domain-containing protein [Petrocella sp. FN5]|uniref:substrate-binding domain-containing protein n=1 Tax=Petrocella sp. FN5 TaxID=3032002 RepID=UPI0023D99842|nr:substrate-binding domain-containing protein [Petrocella sp. FN5]MDF1618527.1 substrate-binding domain-containing protein [Petrocella sp. FN5]
MKLNEKRSKLLLVTFISLGLIISAIWLIILVIEKIDKGNNKIVIGYCADNLVIERWQRDQEIFRTKAIELGAEVIVYNANENNETQNRQIRMLIDQKVDVIVVVPYEKDGITEAINEARKAGIKVIAYDRLITGVTIDAYISFDNVKVGALQTASLIEQAPEGNYVIINGSPEDNNSYMFNDGYMSILEDYIRYGEIDIIEEIWAEDWREEPAYDLISSLIEEGKQIDAIIGANDRLAEAAIRALAEAGQAGTVFVAGHDADISACQRIVEGTQHVTIYKPIKKLAEAAAILAIDLAKGQELNKDETINNGVADIPYIKLDVMTVTKETMMETVVADGFHRKEDIYRE